MANRRIKSKEVRERVGGISRDTLRRWVIDGIVPKPVRINGVRYWNESDVEEFVTSRGGGAR